LSNPEAEGEDETSNRNRRQRLLAAVLSAFPTKDITAYNKRSPRYFELLAERPEEKRALAPLLGLVVARLASALRRWRRLIDDRMRERGQSQIRWHVLWELAANPPGETLTSIAARIGVMSATLVGLMDELEADGLIERTIDENDRRSKLLTLTPEGERTVSWMYALAADVRWELFKGLSESELMILLDAVDIMQSNLDRLDRES
jgi:MarR family transcriptional regulator for hemolysin